MFAYYNRIFIALLGTLLPLTIASADIENGVTIFSDAFSRDDSQTVGNKWIEQNECVSLLCTNEHYEYYLSEVLVERNALGFHYKAPTLVNPPYPSRPLAVRMFEKAYGLPLRMHFEIAPSILERVQYLIGIGELGSSFRFVRDNHWDQPMVPTDGVGIALMRTDSTTNNSQVLIEIDKNGLQHYLYPSSRVLPFQFEYGHKYDVDILIEAGGDVTVKVGNGIRTHTITFNTDFINPSARYDRLFISDLQTGVLGGMEGTVLIDNIVVKAQVSEEDFPTVSLRGDDPLTTILHDQFSDPGATATDAEDGDLTDAIQVDASQVDTSTVGTYEVLYSVTDSDGNTATTTRTVIVEPRPVSNVAFLPGIMGSRLYEATSDGEVKRWETAFADDLAKLKMHEDGTSIRSSIYTRDIVDAVQPLTGIGAFLSFGDAYGQWISFMDSLVEDEVIEAWETIPYDWRLPTDKLLLSGRDRGNMNISYIGEQEGASYILARLEALASSSPTGKVTIVAHSNGGLVAKNLIKYLEDTNHPLLEKIDTLVLVASPQAGTPKALREILHGIDMPGQQTVREVLQYMPGAYGLLPSSRLFTVLEEPVVEVDESVSALPLMYDLAGSTISSYEGLRDFLLGSTGLREAHQILGYKHPNVLEEAILDSAQSMHDEIDTWEAPSHIRTVEVVGTGLWTPRGVQYSRVEKQSQSGLTIPTLQTEWLATSFGDGTVLARSAASGYADETYYIVLNEYNADHDTNFAHGNILSTLPAQEFIQTAVVEGGDHLPQFMNTTGEAQVFPRCEVRAYSPVDIHLYQGDRHAGVLAADATDLGRTYEAQLANSYYEEWVDVKYVGADFSQGDVTLALSGTGEGSFMLELDTLEGDELHADYQYGPIAVTSRSSGAAMLSDGHTPEISYDYDGDGHIDAVLQPGDEYVPDPLLLFGLISTTVREAGLTPKISDWFLHRLEVARSLYMKSPYGTNIAAHMLISSIMAAYARYAPDMPSETTELLEARTGLLLTLL